jgi:hypothetical protein
VSGTPSCVEDGVWPTLLYRLALGKKSHGHYYHGGAWTHYQFRTRASSPPPEARLQRPVCPGKAYKTDHQQHRAWVGAGLFDKHYVNLNTSYCERDPRVLAAGVIPSWRQAALLGTMPLTSLRLCYRAQRGHRGSLPF